MEWAKIRLSFSVSAVVIGAILVALSSGNIQLGEYQYTLIESVGWRVLVVIVGVVLIGTGICLEVVKVGGPRDNKPGRILRQRAKTPAGHETISLVSHAPFEFSIRWVWPIPRFYLTSAYNLVLLHPSDLERIKGAVKIRESGQDVILYRPGVAESDGIEKELIGPFEIFNVGNGRRVAPVYIASTVPEYGPDIRLNSISMSSRLRQELGLEIGMAEVKVVPREEEILSYQLKISYGHPIDAILEEEEEEEEKEKEGGEASEAGGDLIEQSRILVIERIPPQGRATVALVDRAMSSVVSILKISTHEHYRSGADIGGFIRVMDMYGIEKAVFVPTGEAPDNKGYENHMQELLKMQRLYPTRIIAFATVVESDSQAPRIFEQAVDKGARGLKLIGGHPAFHTGPLNSENVYRVIELCDKLSLPVLVHASMLRSHRIREEFQCLLRDFPDVTFIAAHYGKLAPALSEMEDLLRSFPNLCTDISMGRGVYRYLALIHSEPNTLFLRKSSAFLFS